MLVRRLGQHLFHELCEAARPAAEPVLVGEGRQLVKVGDSVVVCIHPTSILRMPRAGMTSIKRKDGTLSQ